MDTWLKCVVCILISFIVALANFYTCKLLWKSTKFGETTPTKTILCITQGVFVCTWAGLLFVVGGHLKEKDNVYKFTAIGLIVAYVVSWLWMANFSFDDFLNDTTAWKVSGRFILPILYPCAILQITVTVAFVLWKFVVMGQAFGQGRKPKRAKGLGFMSTIANAIVPGAGDLMNGALKFADNLEGMVGPDLGSAIGNIGSQLLGPGMGSLSGLAASGMPAELGALIPPGMASAASAASAAASGAVPGLPAGLAPPASAPAPPPTAP